jgi:hypothetical protein
MAETHVKIYSHVQNNTTCAIMQHKRIGVEKIKIVARKTPVFLVSNAIHQHRSTLPNVALHTNQYKAAMKITPS